ncbi:MAG: PKD domain-containing protein [Vicingaceae bacterium]
MVSPTNHMWMWSFSDVGEGVFTLYPFIAGEIYEVSYKLWMDATSNPISQFRVELSNGLAPVNGPSTAMPTPIGNQSLTTQAWSGTNSWITITETFTASQNYNQLWFYPYLSAIPQTGQAACRIDDICIKNIDDPCEMIKHSTIEVAGTEPFTFNVSGLPNDLYEFLGFNWDFGDGNTASGLSVSHDYSLDVVGPGSITYTVCLTVYYFDPTTSQCCHEVICTDVVIEPSDPIDPIDDGGGVAGG